VNDFPYLAPPDDGLRRAMGDARRRRYRTAGFSTSSVAAAVLVLAALAGGQGTQSLVEQPAPQQPAVTQVVPDGGTTARTAPRPNQAQPGQVAGQSAGASTGAAGASTGAAPAVASRAQSAKAPPAPPAYVAGTIERQDNYASTIPGTCRIGDTSSTAALCPSTYVQGDGSKASPYVFQAEVCSSRTSLTLLHYAGANEVELAVYRVDAKGPATEVWRWSRTNPDSPSPHTVGLQAASCTNWVFTWTKVASHGAPLGPGTYELRARFLAEELKGYAVPTTGFTIS
jgi:hypothetical protein